MKLQEEYSLLAGTNDQNIHEICVCEFLEI